MPAAAIDLTTVALIKQFLPAAASSNDDTELQAIITGVSQAVLDLTGRDSLNTIGTYTEVRNGNGAVILFTKNCPITTLTSVQVNGMSLPIATGYNTAGAALSPNKDAVVLQGVGGGSFTGQFVAWQAPSRFPVGWNNVQLVYEAGYGATPADLQDAVTRLVAQQYMRRQTIDQKSKVTDVAGSRMQTSYRDWLMEPWVKQVVWKYTRVASLY